MATVIINIIYDDSCSEYDPVGEEEIDLFKEDFKDR